MAYTRGAMLYKKNFDEWNKSKKGLESGPIEHYGHAGEVWWCSLGINIGIELDILGEEIFTKLKRAWINLQ